MFHDSNNSFYRPLPFLRYSVQQASQMNGYPGRSVYTAGQHGIVLKTKI